MNQTPPSAAALSQLYRDAATQNNGLKYSLISSVLVLIYDTFLTLDEEVEFIWKQRFSAVTFVFFMNRWYAIPATIVFALQEIIPAFTTAICEKMMRFPLFAVSIPLTIFPNIIIGLRIYALYERNRILGILIVLFNITLIGLGLWLYLEPSLRLITLPGPSSLNEILPLHTCHAATSAKLSNLQTSSFQFSQTAFDSLALILILWKTYLKFLELRSLTGIRSVMLRHGFIYYVFVFSLKLPLAIMIVCATVRLKNAMSGPALALGPMAANRLTLSLRAYAYNDGGDSDTSSKDSDFGTMFPRKQRRRSWIGTSTFQVDEGSRRDTTDTQVGSYELRPVEVALRKDGGKPSRGLVNTPAPEGL